MKKTVGVYFIQSINGGPIKIGLSHNIEQRIKSIQAVNPFAIKVLAIVLTPTIAEAFDYESKMHKQFDKFRLHGEWFMPSYLLMKHIEDIEKSPPTIEKSIHTLRMEKNKRDQILIEQKVKEKEKHDKLLAEQKIKLTNEYYIEQHKQNIEKIIKEINEWPDSPYDMR